MQRETESIDRKNGRSSGSECPGSTQGELKDGKRKEGGKKEKKEVRDVVTIASKT